MAGSRTERGRCWDYLTWLLKLRRGSRVVVADLQKRDDCAAVRVARGAATRAGGATLRSIELETKTFCFSAPDRDDPEGKEELVLIFGADERRRRRAMDLVEDAMRGRYRARERDARGGRGRGASRDGGGGPDRGGYGRDDGRDDRPYGNGRRRGRSRDRGRGRDRSPRRGDRSRSPAPRRRDSPPAPKPDDRYR